MSGDGESKIARIIRNRFGVRISFGFFLLFIRVELTWEIGDRNSVDFSKHFGVYVQCFIRFRLKQSFEIFVFVFGVKKFILRVEKNVG